jgi:hypothetical protein
MAHGISSNRYGRDYTHSEFNELLLAQAQEFLEL